MARSKPPAIKRGLTALEALAELVKIDRSLDAVCSTAPKAVAAMGGREALQSYSQMTCIGPVPRLSAEEWEPLSEEHAEGQRDAARPKDFYIDQSHRP